MSYSNENSPSTGQEIPSVFYSNLDKSRHTLPSTYFSEQVFSCVSFRFPKIRAQQKLRHRTGLSRSEQFKEQHEFSFFLFFLFFFYFRSYVTIVTLNYGAWRCVTVMLVTDVSRKDGSSATPHKVVRN